MLICWTMGIDVSAILKPAVYILRNRGAVVWVGAARVPLVRLYGHQTYRRGKPVPSWHPGKPMEFDAVELRPCLVDELEKALDEVREELGWSLPQPRRLALVNA